MRTFFFGVFINTVLLPRDELYVHNTTGRLVQTPVVLPHLRTFGVPERVQPLHPSNGLTGDRPGGPEPTYPHPLKRSPPQEYDYYVNKGRRPRWTSNSLVTALGCVSGTSLTEKRGGRERQPRRVIFPPERPSRKKDSHRPVTQSLWTYIRWVSDS